MNEANTLADILGDDEPDKPVLPLVSSDLHTLVQKAMDAQFGKPDADFEPGQEC